MTYCSSLTTRQVENVLKDEDHRRKHSTGDVWQAAEELYKEAREELLRRGIEPDEVLSSNK